MTTVDSALSLDARRHFLHALRRVLRPIVRMLIRNGIRYDEFAEVARGAFVESAVRDGIDHTSGLTREKIALVTGIARQRVDHYIDDDDALPMANPTPTRVMTEVLHKWHTDPRYLGPEGVPLELELEAPQGRSFRSLVADVDAEVNPALVFEELLSAGSICFSDDNRIRALSRYFLWHGASLSSIEYFGATLAHLIATHEYNFDPATAENRRLDRTVFPDRGLPRRLLSEFQVFAKERISQFLLDIDDWFARFSDTHARQSGPRVETGINVFLYVEPPPDNQALTTMVQPTRLDPQPGEKTTA